jgi:aerobic-type carbon monoxide dehydrogenase small subunit (CoxS/CutS family)
VIAFVCNGDPVEVDEAHASLLDALREELGLRGAKDGCSPQGQCGCCTVLVDGAARVACVTPVRRVAGRKVTTIEGLDEEVRGRWAAAFVDAGASQCGFCTPGIVMRLVALGSRRGAVDEGQIRTALAAHLCRCTGWQSIVDAATQVLGTETPAQVPARDPLLSQWRAGLEGANVQHSGGDVVLGTGAGFADDRAPAGALVALPEVGSACAAPAAYSVGTDLASVRSRLGKVQGRRSTVPLRYPLDPPPGPWDLTLQTTWVEPAYLEPDASWSEPGGVGATPLANGGAFGAKRSSPVPADARRLADAEGRAVRVLWPRETVVRRGPKRPPVALGLRADGTGALKVARTPGSTDLSALHAAMAAVAPGVSVSEVAVTGPPVSADLRGAGWAEVTAAMVALAARAGGWSPGDPVEARVPSGGRARVRVVPAGPGGRETVEIEVWAGEPLDPVVLRSFCSGAAHQALGWVRSEGVAVDAAGDVHDLTIRSFGVLPARDTPHLALTVHASDLWPVNGSDAVFAAAAAAAWLTDGLAPRWPTRRGVRAGTSPGQIATVAE